MRLSPDFIGVQGLRRDETIGATCAGGGACTLAHADLFVKFPDRRAGSARMANQVQELCVGARAPDASEAVGLEHVQWTLLDDTARRRPGDQICEKLSGRKLGVLREPRASGLDIVLRLA